MNDSIVRVWSVPRGQRDADAVLTPVGQRRVTTTTVADVRTDGVTPQQKSTALPSKGQVREGESEPPAKRRKDAKSAKDADRSPPTHVSLADLGGVDSVIHELTELIALPILFPAIYNHSGIQPPRGVLLHGPPGCGKTMIANAFAAELGVSYIPVSAPSVVSGMSGESEKKLRDYFDEARRMAPCLMFIDEIDAITPKRESAQREMEKRIVAQDSEGML